MSRQSIVTFPALSFSSGDEFRRFRSENRDIFDERYRREQSLGTVAPAVVMEGVCAPCLQVTEFSSPTQGGMPAADGRRVPQWRQAQLCGCRFGLTSQERALIHIALQNMGQPSWFRAGVVGAGSGVAAYLSQFLPDVAQWPRLTRGAGRTLSLPVSPASQHMVLAADFLPHVIPLKHLLTAVADALAPGGSFVFSSPFDVEADQTISVLGEQEGDGRMEQIVSAQAVRRLGWDLLALLIDCGFTDAAGHCYWSEEFGYLGPYNMVFVAHR